MTPEEELVMEQTYKLTVHKLQEIANVYCKDKDAEIKKANERIKELEDYKLALSDLVESLTHDNALYKIRIETFPEISKEEFIEKLRFTELKTLSNELMMAAWCAWTGSYQFCAPWCATGFREEVIYMTKDHYENVWKLLMKSLGD